MSMRDEFEYIRQVAWDAVGTDIETEDKALAKIHEFAKKQAAQAPASGEAVGVIELSDYVQLGDDYPVPRRKVLAETSKDSIQGLPVGAKLYTNPPASGEAVADQKGVFIPCDNYKVPDLKDGAVVICLVDGEQTRLQFCQAEDGEYWWRDSDCKLAAPSHYSMWSIPFPDAVFSSATPASAVPEWVNQVVAERQRQDEKWGGPVHDDQKSPNDFVQHIEDYAGWARVMAGMGSFEKYRRRMIQVAALAGAAVEAIDRAIARSAQPPKQEN